MPSALLVIGVAIFSYSIGLEQELESAKEQLDTMPSWKKEPDRKCPENMEWTDRMNEEKNCNLRPPPPMIVSPYVLVYKQGCQCKNGFYESNGRCVPDCSKERCPVPNAIRSNCTARPHCQPSCFQKPENSLYICYKSCIPFECECKNGYIRVDNSWEGSKCISLETCKKLKTQYGSTLPPNFKP
ncbi:unnamed protein product [Cylicocyclus nassatus]|uniref:TIL domain-containing protein n=1 Tax=Cylicocyclus nassatus TaxID=53992 RepID=A0AA36GN20_CYLNA|nr:unnamed protein product [Cylicocyclus nassatus]